MTQSNIPQYHHSYSEDENLSIYKYLKSATNKNLVENIFILCQSYPEEHQKNIIEALLQFGKEIADREYLNNCYNELLRCVNAWKKYKYSLETYPSIMKIREAYRLYKEEPGELPEGSLLFDSFMVKYEKTVCAGYAYSTVQQFLISEDKKRGIKRPKRPKDFYHSLQEIAVKQYSPKEALALLKKSELEDIIITLLECADAPELQNRPSVIIRFLTSKYRFPSHKKSAKLFTSTTKGTLDLKDNCDRLLKELKQLQKETTQLEEEQNI